MIIVTSALMIGYFMRVKPFHSGVEQSSVTADEFILVTTLVLIMILAIFELVLDVEVYILLGWIITSLILTSVIKNVVIALVGAIKNVIQKRREKREAKLLKEYYEIQ